jgi:hypothetical protein
MMGWGIVFGTMVFAAGGGGEAADLPARHAEAILKRMRAMEGFLGSQEERQTRSQVGRYFSAAEYSRLRGNPVVGYWDAGSFAWKGGARVAWGGIRSAHPSCRPIGGNAWQTAFVEVAKRRGLEVVPKAAVTVEGGCVAAVVDGSEEERVPGVLLEIRVRSEPARSLLLRVAIGKPTVEDAMGAALDLALRFSRNLGEVEDASAR